VVYLTVDYYAIDLYKENTVIKICPFTQWKIFYTVDIPEYEFTAK